jgi:hypothetical protein
MRRNRHRGARTVGAGARHGRAPLSTAAVLIAVALMSTACADDDQEPTTQRSHAAPGTRNSSAPRTSDATDASQANTTSPTQQSSPSSPPTARTHDTSRASRARLAQIPAAQLPGFNDEWQWDTATGHRGPLPASASPSSGCMHASMTAIGAVAEYSTVYASEASDDAAAALTVPSFPTSTRQSPPSRCWRPGSAPARSSLRPPAGSDEHI